MVSAVGSVQWWLTFVSAHALQRIMPGHTSLVQGPVEAFFILKPEAIERFYVDI